MGFSNAVFTSGGASNGGIPGDIHSCVSITYAQLVADSLGAALQCGQAYRITDFRTVHIILGVNGSSSVSPIHLGRIEPIVVTATSAATVGAAAWSPSNPDDIIIYQMVDNTSANPGDGSSRGIITYRENVEQNLSTYYDFRNVVFYRPLTTYSEIAAGLFPITINSIVIDGVVTAFSAVVNDSTEFMEVLQKNLFPPAIAFWSPVDVLYFLWSTEGGEFGVINITDNTVSTYNMGAAQSFYEFFTFGNNIIYPVVGNPGIVPDISPAADGDQLSTHSNNHIGQTNDWWWGIAQANIVFGLGASLNDLGDEAIYSSIGNDSNSIGMFAQNFSLNIASYCNVFVFDREAAMGFFGTLCYGIYLGKDAGAHTYIRQNNGNIFLGDSTRFFESGLNCQGISVGCANEHVTLGDDVERIFIADNAQLALGYDITIPDGTTDSRLEIGFSNFETIINPDGSGIIDLTTPVLQYIGVVRVENAANDLLKIIGLVPMSRLSGATETHHPVTIYTASGIDLVIQDKDTSGGAGNIYLFNIPDMTLEGDREQSASFQLGRNDDTKVTLLNPALPATV